MTMGSGLPQGFWLPGQQRGDFAWYTGGEWVASHLDDTAFLKIPANLNVGGWARFGSLVAPNQQNAGHVTMEALWIPDQLSSTLTGLLNVYSNGANMPVAVRLDSSSSVVGIRVQGAAVAPIIRGTRSGGTIASPSAVTNGITLVQLDATGFYDASNHVGPHAALSFLARQNWSSTARGTYAIVRLTPNGSTTLQDYHYFYSDGYATPGGVFVGYTTTLPTNAGNGALVVANKIHPGDQTDFWIQFLSSKPTFNMDSGDYYEYDRSNNRHDFYIGNSLVARIDSNGIGASSIANRTRNAYLPAGVWTARTGAPALAPQGSNGFYDAWALDSAATEDVIASWAVPEDWASGSLTLKVVHTNLGAGAGNVRWLVAADSIAVGDNMNTLGNTGQDTVAATTQNVKGQFTSSVTLTVVAGETINFIVQRVGGDAADTLGNDVGFQGLEIEYTADM